MAEAVSRFDSARTLGTTLELGLGLELRSKSIVDHKGYPVGGYCIELLPGARAVDEYGEVTESAAAYCTFDAAASWDNAFHVLQEDDVDLSVLSTPHSTNLVNVIRRFAKPIAHVGPGRRSGLWTSADSDLVRWMANLNVVVMGGLRPPVALPRRREESDEF